MRFSLQSVNQRCFGRASLVRLPFLLRADAATRLRHGGRQAKRTFVAAYQLAAKWTFNFARAVNSVRVNEWALVFADLIARDGTNHLSRTCATFAARKRQRIGSESAHCNRNQAQHYG